MMFFDECDDKVTSCTLTDGTFTVGTSQASAYKLTSTTVPRPKGTYPASQAPDSASVVTQQVKPKGTYVPLGFEVPVFAIMLGVIALGMGGGRKRGY